jgi:hypothetical protein
MKTDPIFYELFRFSPESLFEPVQLVKKLIGKKWWTNSLVLNGMIFRRC